MPDLPGHRNVSHVCCPAIPGVFQPVLPPGSTIRFLQGQPSPLKMNPKLHPLCRALSCSNGAACAPHPCALSSVLHPCLLSSSLTASLLTLTVTVATLFLHVATHWGRAAYGSLMANFLRAHGRRPRPHATCPKSHDAASPLFEAQAITAQASSSLPGPLHRAVAHRSPAAPRAPPRHQLSLQSSDAGG